MAEQDAQLNWAYGMQMSRRAPQLVSTDESSVNGYFSPGSYRRSAPLLLAQLILYPEQNRSRLLSLRCMLLLRYH
jgi:hypothetical protein